MKKFNSLFVLAALLICLIPLQSMESIDHLTMSAPKDKQEVKGDDKKVKEKNKENCKIAKELQAKEQKKKQIEAREHSVNKNKRAKRFSTDKNIHETVRQRNIP